MITVELVKTISWFKSAVTGGRGTSGCAVGALSGQHEVGYWRIDLSPQFASMLGPP